MITQPVFVVSWHSCALHSVSKSDLVSDAVLTVADVIALPLCTVNLLTCYLLSALLAPVL